MHKRAVIQQEPMIQIQRLDLVQSQDTRHVDVEEGKLLLIDIRIQLELRSSIFSSCGRSVPREGNVGALVEFLGELASQGVPGVGFGVY